MNNETMKKPNTDEIFLEVVYNGKPIGLSKEEAVTLSQKGINYDRLYEKYQQLSEQTTKNQGYKEKIDAIAAQLGITPEKVLESLENERKEFEVSEYAQEKGIPTEYAKMIRELELKLAESEKQKNELLPIKKRQKEIEEFNKVYPDIDYRDIDKEIIAQWEESEKPLIDVYNAVIVNNLRKTQAANKANEHNSKASCGSVTGVPDQEETVTEEMIKNMSDKEFTKNFKNILKQYNK